MAAVAGSKGKIAVGCRDTELRPSFQASLVDRLLKGLLTADHAAEELLQGARLREVGIDTNMMCNLRCKYCYLDDRAVRAGKIGVASWLERLEPLATRGCKLFAFIGKEPLLDDIALSVIEGLSSRRESNHRFRMGMVTNGTQLPRQGDRLRNAGVDYLDISLDGLAEVNDPWRGAGVSDAVLKNLAQYVSRGFNHDLFVACVLHQGNRHDLERFVRCLFDIGVPGIFTSPVLKFTGNNSIKDWALSFAEIPRVIDELLKITSAHGHAGHQVVIDLPYRYAWQLLASGVVSAASIYEDAFEVPFWRPDPAQSVFVKMNLLSYSYWKAIRITHDGTLLENMDLAAHPDYATVTDLRRLAVATQVCTPCATGRRFHRRFMEEHIHATAQQFPYDRDVRGQYAFEARSLALA